MEINKDFRDNKDNEISLIDIWYIIRRNILLIVSFSSFLLLIFGFFAFFVSTPKYISTADVMVQVEQDSGSSSDPNFDLVNAFRLIDTVAELMKKDIILINTIEKLEELGYENLDTLYLRDGLQISTSPSSYFINISFIDEDGKLSKDIVDNVINAVIEETDVFDAFPVLTNKIRRTSFSSEPLYHSPNKILISFTGLILGLILSVGFVLSRELLSTKFRNKEDLEEAINVQILGIIPKMNVKEILNEKK